jgi:hypothetical protein
MSIRSKIQGYLFKLGFILFICIPQSQTFGFSLLDFKKLPFRNNIELVSNKKHYLKRKNLDYFSYKQYLSSLLDVSNGIQLQQLYRNEFIKLYNSKIKVTLDQNDLLFNFKIAPTLIKNKGLKINSLFKIDSFPYSA